MHSAQSHDLQELSFNEIEQVSGGILFTTGVVIGGLTALGIAAAWAYGKINKWW